jgi:hypothetical protein
VGCAWAIVADGETLLIAFFPQVDQHFSLFAVVILELQIIADHP